MKLDKQPVVVRAGATVVVALTVAAVPFYALSWHVPTPPLMFGPRGYATAFGLICGMAGALIAARKPDNAIGWIWLVAGLFATTQGLGEAYALNALRQPGDWSPLSAWAAWTSEWMWIVYLEATGVIAAIFPDGRWRSRGWRNVIVIGCIGSVVAVVGNALTPDLMIFSEFENPVGLHGVDADAYLRAVSGFTWVFGLGLILAGAASAIVRFRHSRGDERQQLKWLALAAAVIGVATTTVGVIVITPAGGFSGITPPGFDWVENLTVLSLLGIPIAMAIGILRHRLFDVDVVINRALVYGAVTTLLAIGYVGVILGLQAVLPRFARDSALAVATSTLAMVALFRPLRRRVQDVVDRSFYRRGYDAGKTIEHFGAHLRHEADLETLANTLVTLVDATMQPAHTSLWLCEVDPDGD
jgi:hypothetical protein